MLDKCTYSYLPFEQLSPLCDDVLGHPVEQNADNPAVGFDQGHRVLPLGLPCEDAAQAGESLPDGRDVAQSGAHFGIVHDISDAPDEIELRLLDFAPGEYLVRVWNLTDPQEPREVVRPTRQLVKCDVAEDFPSFAGSDTLKRNGGSCGCGNPDSRFQSVRDANDATFDRAQCVFDPCPRHDGVGFSSTWTPLTDPDTRSTLLSPFRSTDLRRSARRLAA